MKRKILLGLGVAITLTVVEPVMPVLAQESQEVCIEEQGIMPRYNYIQMASIGIDPSDSGSSYMLIVRGISSVTSISGKVTVYKKNFWGNYKEVDSEDVSEKGSKMEKFGNLSSDGAGDYKIEFVGNVYVSGGSEPITISATKSY